MRYLEMGMRTNILLTETCLNIFKSKRLEEKVHVSETLRIQVSVMHF